MAQCLAFPGNFFHMHCPQLHLDHTMCLPEMLGPSPFYAMSSLTLTFEAA